MGREVGETYGALLGGLLLRLLKLLAQGGIGGDLFLKVLVILSANMLEHWLIRKFKRTLGEEVVKISILYASRPGTNFTEHSFDVDAGKYSVLHFVAACVLFGDRSFATRPHVVCPVAAVEVDISENDLFFPA